MGIFVNHEVTIDIKIHDDIIILELQIKQTLKLLQLDCKQIVL